MATAQVEIPSHERVEPGSHQLPTAAYPKEPATPAQDVNQVAERWTASFNGIIHKQDYAALSDVFLKDSFWRDQLCLTWAFHTLKGPEKMASFLQGQPKGCRLTSVALDTSSEVRKPNNSAVDFSGTVKCIQAFLKVETDIGRGRGLVRLLQEPETGKWKAFTLFTCMHELKGHEEASGPRRPPGVEHGGNPGRKNWMERRIAESNFEDGREPTVLILGKWSRCG